MLPCVLIIEVITIFVCLSLELNNRVKGFCGGGGYLGVV